MTKAIVKAGVTKNVIRANVAKDGNVKLSGVLPQNAYNPLVEVDFSDNKQTDQHKNGKYLKNVLVKLQKTYGFKKFNVVAHSMRPLFLSRAQRLMGSRHFRTDCQRGRGQTRIL